MFLHRVNNIRQYKVKCLYWHGGDISYTSMIMYIKTGTLKNDASSEIIKFQGDIFFKEHS